MTSNTLDKNHRDFEDTDHFSSIQITFNFSLFIETADFFSLFILIQLLCSVIYLACSIFLSDTVRFHTSFELFLLFSPNPLPATYCSCLFEFSDYATFWFEHWRSFLLCICEWLKFISLLPFRRSIHTEHSFLWWFIVRIGMVSIIHRIETLHDFDDCKLTTTASLSWIWSCSIEFEYILRSKFDIDISVDISLLIAFVF